VGESRGGSGPRSGAVDELCRVKDSGRSVNFDCVVFGVVGGASGDNGSIGAKVDGGVADGSYKSGGELAGVEAVLIEENEVVIARRECGEQASQLFVGERVV